MLFKICTIKRELEQTLRTLNKRLWVLRKRKVIWGNLLKTHRNWKVKFGNFPTEEKSRVTNERPSTPLMFKAISMSIFWLKFHPLSFSLCHMQYIYSMIWMEWDENFHSCWIERYAGWMMLNVEWWWWWWVSRCWRTETLPYTLNWLLLRWEYSRIKDIYPLKYFIKSHE